MIFLQFEGIKKVISKLRANYYKEHSIQAMVNSPGKIAVAVTVGAMILAVVGSHFIKIKK